MAVKMINLWKKFKAADAFRKRGIIYCSIAIAGILYEVIFVTPVRSIVLILWAGIFGVGLMVIFSLKEIK